MGSISPPLKSLEKSPKKTICKAKQQDDFIMGTNNSSIVSKRSVERLYFGDEPHFFRYFVKKPQRRAPLINWGYGLRMRAIDQAVRRFLDRPCKKRKVVINLGCGYDPLPWQCLSRYKALSAGVVFIDVDYRDLMLKKRRTVQETPELLSMLTNVETSEGDIIFRSGQYIQIACDLRQLSQLGQALAQAVDVEHSSILMVAEVSITYMSQVSADALINWASKLPEAQFCLLEQILPDGEETGFAQTMMAHFNKLQTSLGSVRSYPTTSAQRDRFVSLGWTHVLVRNLWNLWNDLEFLNEAERLKLQEVEPMDEIEEFALFGLHYFVLLASNFDLIDEASSLVDQNAAAHSKPGQMEADLIFSENPKGKGLSRFGAPMRLKGSTRLDDAIGNFAGMGSITRTSSCDTYSIDQQDPLIFQSKGWSDSPSGRMCHTITDLEDCGLFLVGGRTSPDKALVDSWIYHKYSNSWERVDDLPLPRYRHSAVWLGGSAVLVTPGRIDSREIAKDFLVWNRRRGWRTCQLATGESICPVYGATCLIFPATSSTTRNGLLAGGMCAEGTMLRDVWEWKLEGFDSETPSISFRRYESLSTANLSLIARVGAATVSTKEGTYIVGGIIRDATLESWNDICLFRLNAEGNGELIPVKFKISPGTPRPLLIGISIVARGNTLLIMGGSAVCFSFGTYWNKGVYKLQLSDPTERIIDERLLKTSNCKWEYSGTIAAAPPGVAKLPVTPKHSLEAPADVPKIQVKSIEDFEAILKAHKPVVFKTSLGSCTEKWNTEYLKQQVGSDRKVVVHEASSQIMDFNSKNFAYVTMNFGDFLAQAEINSNVYMRSVASEKPSESPTNLSQDFPSIAEDFQLPPELNLVSENMHSSPLRISGKVQMWLHYDVMANILCQIRGSKRLRLFPPSDVRHFHLEPGSSSSSIDVFSSIPASAHAFETTLSADEAIYIPPLWLHAVNNAFFNISVNVFFHNPHFCAASSYASGRDVYANRDLQAYERGRQDVARIVKAFEKLPKEAREFYLARLVDELGEKVR